MSHHFLNIEKQSFLHFSYSSRSEVETIVYEHFDRNPFTCIGTLSSAPSHYTVITSSCMNRKFRLLSTRYVLGKLKMEVFRNYLNTGIDIVIQDIYHKEQVKPPLQHGEIPCHSQLSSSVF